jgi:aldose 1-epimerase
MAANSVAPSGEQLEIGSGDQRAVVVEFGGGLRSYAVRDVDVLDGYGADEMCSSGRGQVLMPWPNRIEDGSYELDGRRQQLALTEPENGNAIHGLVRWVGWSVAERDADRVAVEHVLHPQPGYPFTLALRIEYALSDDGLAVRTTATNVGTGACPFGSGAHPYLTLGTEPIDAVVLQVPALNILRTDDLDFRSASCRSRERTTTSVKRERSARRSSTTRSPLFHTTTTASRALCSAIPKATRASRCGSTTRIRG